MKQDSGIDIITKLKSNIKFTFKQPVLFDKSASVNIGVAGEFCVGLNNTGTMRLIHYINPEDGENYYFMTTLSDFEPGLIAWLYLKRWNVEKVYDVKKNKLYEQKSWATKETAQEIQDIFISISFNLLQLMLVMFKSKFNIKDSKLKKKRSTW